IPGKKDRVIYWRRPGKEKGHSATTGHCKSKNGWELFFCFTSNGGCFESGKPYSKFAVYTLLNHNGDFKSAAADLRKLGYGDPETQKGGAATSGAEHTPDGLIYRHENLTIMVSKKRTRWCVKVIRGQQLLGVNVASLADAKGRREIIKSLGDIQPEE